MRFGKIRLALCLLLSCLSIGSMAATVAPHTLVVGVKVAPPFVMKNGNQYAGLAVDLWQQTAADHQWKYRYQQYDLKGLLAAVQDGSVDVGLGAITTTAKRAQTIDFSHPLATSGLGVAVRDEGSSGWLAVAQAILSPAFLSIVGVLVLLLLIVGFVVWLLEHKKNPDDFGGSRPAGIFSGFWWAMVTLTTVGYGDTAPRTVPGRILGMIWMLTALIIVSFFTASMTSALTVGQLSSKISSPADLAKVRIASVANSTSGDWLDYKHYKYVHVDSLKQALQELADKQVDAVVYDAPLLRWQISQQFQGKLSLLPFTLERQDYAFALPRDSKLRLPINSSLLKQINSPEWNAYLARYLGTKD